MHTLRNTTLGQVPDAEFSSAKWDDVNYYLTNFSGFLGGLNEIYTCVMSAFNARPFSSVKLL